MFILASYRDFAVQSGTYCHKDSLFKDREQSQIRFFPSKDLFLEACAACSELTSNISTMHSSLLYLHKAHILSNNIVYSQ